MRKDSRLLALAALAVGVVIAVTPFLYLHFTGSGVLFLVCAPLVLVLCGFATFSALRSRPRIVSVAIVATVVAGFACWMIVGLTLFVLSCNNIIDTASC
jgi:hypothetical protein